MNKKTIINYLRLYKLNRFLHQPILFKRELFYMRKHVLEGLYIMQNLQEFVSLDNDCLCNITSFLTGDDFFLPRDYIIYD
jgi:hypothetical protein